MRDRPPSLNKSERKTRGICQYAKYSFSLKIYPAFLQSQSSWALRRPWTWRQEESPPIIYNNASGQIFQTKFATQHCYSLLMLHTLNWLKNGNKGERSCHASDS